MLIDGDALAIAGHGDELTFESGGATVALRDGAARVRRSSGTTVAVYEGRADVAALGRRMDEPVRAFRQVTVADTGALPRRPVPLVFDRADPDRWDTLYLHDAIDLGGQLERQARAVTGQPAPATIDASYLKQIVPALRSARGFGPDLVKGTSRSVGETVVGASIALSGTGDLPARWSAAFDFRDQGADWGLVAADQQARRAGVLGILDGVLNRVTPVFAPVATGARPNPSGSAPPPTSTGPSTTTPPTSGGPPTTVPVTPARPAVPPVTVPLLPSTPPTTTPARPDKPGKPDKPDKPSSPPTTPPRTTPTIPPVTVPPPVQGLLDGLLGGGGSTPPSNVVGGLLDRLGGLLGGASHPDSPDELDDLIGAVDGLLGRSSTVQPRGPASP
jgi:hypothetical protein